MKTLKINDLELSKDMDDASMKTVSGGMNFGAQGGQLAPVGVAGGGFFSPQVVTSAPVNAPVAQINDNDLHLDIENKTANVLASAFTGVFQ